MCVSSHALHVNIGTKPSKMSGAAPALGFTTSITRDAVWYQPDGCNRRKIYVWNSTRRIPR